MRLEVRYEDSGEVDEIEITEHAVKLGSAVEKGDLLVEIATDKVDVEISAPQAGTVVELPIAEGATADSAAVLAILEVAD